MKNQSIQELKESSKQLKNHLLDRVSHLLRLTGGLNEDQCKDHCKFDRSIDGAYVVTGITTRGIVSGNFQPGKSCTFLLPDLNFDELLCVYGLLESTLELALRDRVTSILENDHPTVETRKEENRKDQLDALLMSFLELRHKDTVNVSSR